MKNRITELFKKKSNHILSVFYTAGFPELTSTVPIAKYLSESGADIIEIGIPFSDPVADGPTIQESNKRALDNGTNLRLILDEVRNVRRQKVETPIILMGYINPVMQYGIERFLKDASDAGVDGVILPDLPVTEYEEEYRSLFEAHNLCNTFLISPTTSEQRIREIDMATRGFIYAVSASATTGARGTFTDDQVAYFERLRKMELRNPFLIGFGISNRETFTKASQYSAGAIVGSAFIQLLKTSTDLEKDVKAFIKELRKTS